MRIMIVDDSGTMRTIQRRCLEKLGVTNIVEAPNGQVALDLFDQTTIDIVLTDWNMPVMDGLTLLKEIRSRNKVIPVIMLTTLACKANVVSALTAGVSDLSDQTVHTRTLARETREMDFESGLTIRGGTCQ